MSDKIGPYEIIEQIAEGGMAEVFLAEKKGSQGFSKRLVVKKLLPQYKNDSEFQRLFSREASLLVNIQHPNLVQVYDFIKSGSDYLLAMEYVEGISLVELDSDSVSVDLVAYVAVQILSGLSALHKNPDGSILHRDISPDNILLSKNGDVKLADFGIAKQQDKNLREEKTALIGKMKYAAPELIYGDTLDQKSDLYSLGKVLWQIIYQNMEIPKGKIEQENFLSNIDDAKKQALVKLLLFWLNENPDKRRYNAVEAIEYIESNIAIQSGVLKNELAAIVEDSSVDGLNYPKKTKLLDYKSTKGKSIGKMAMFLALFAVMIAISILMYFTSVDNDIAVGSNDYSSTSALENDFEEAKVTYSLFPVDSRRKAKIYVDFTEFGYTPLVLKLAPGRHVLALSTADGKTIQHVVFLKPGANPEFYFSSSSK